MLTKLKEKVKQMDYKQMIKTAFMLSFFMAIFTPELFLASEQAKAEFIGKFETFETLFIDLISILGTIYTLWCISEWGLAWHESNGTIGGQSFKRIFGGLVVVLSPQILAILA